MNCPNIGPFGFCNRTDCMNSLTGHCRWLDENSVVYYSNTTSPDGPTDKPQVNPHPRTTSAKEPK